MSNTGARIKPEAVREVAFGTVTDAFAKMGANFTGPIRILYIANETDKVLYFSLDGTTDHFRVLANSFRLFDLKTNDLFAKGGDAIYVRGITADLPSSGQATVEASFS